MERRKFVLIVSSPALSASHSTLVEAIQHHSDGDFIEILKCTSAERGSKATGRSIPFTVAYLFSTDQPPSKMGFGLPTHDSYVLLEVGAATWVDGFSRVREWLDRHRDRE